MDFSQVCRQKGLTFQDLRAQGQRIPQEHLFHNSTPKGFKISKGVQKFKVFKDFQGLMGLMGLACSKGLLKLFQSFMDKA